MTTEYESAASPTQPVRLSDVVIKESLSDLKRYPLAKYNKSSAGRETIRITERGRTVAKAIFEKYEATEGKSQWYRLIESHKERLQLGDHTEFNEELDGIILSFLKSYMGGSIIYSLMSLDDVPREHQVPFYKTIASIRKSIKARIGHRLLFNNRVQETPLPPELTKPAKTAQELKGKLKSIAKTALKRLAACTAVAAISAAGWFAAENPNTVLMLGSVLNNAVSGVKVEENVLPEEMMEDIWGDLVVEETETVPDQAAESHNVNYRTVSQPLSVGFFEGDTDAAKPVTTEQATEGTVVATVEATEEPVIITATPIVPTDMPTEEPTALPTEASYNFGDIVIATETPQFQATEESRLTETPPAEQNEVYARSFYEYISNYILASLPERREMIESLPDDDPRKAGYLAEMDEIERRLENGEAIVFNLVITDKGYEIGQTGSDLPSDRQYFNVGQEHVGNTDGIFQVIMGANGTISIVSIGRNQQLPYMVGPEENMWRAGSGEAFTMGGQVQWNAENRGIREQMFPPSEGYWFSENGRIYDRQGGIVTWGSRLGPAVDSITGQESMMTLQISLEMLYQYADYFFPNGLTINAPIDATFWRVDGAGNRTEALFVFNAGETVTLSASDLVTIMRARDVTDGEGNLIDIGGSRGRGTWFAANFLFPNMDQLVSSVNWSAAFMQIARSNRNGLTQDPFAAPRDRKVTLFQGTMFFNLFTESLASLDNAQALSLGGMTFLQGSNGFVIMSNDDLSMLDTAIDARLGDN